MEQELANQALRDFEISLGLVTPETAGIEEADKQLGPAPTTRQTETDG